jgi:GntR family transcriptional regulator
MTPRIERVDPPYIQITDHFRQRIQDGLLPDGAKLPAVSEIAKTWSVAHATAAKAVSQLQVEGLITSSPRGSFVTGKATNASTPHDRIMRARRVGTLDAEDEHHQVTAAEIIDAPAYVAELLDLEPGAQVVRREYVTIADKTVRSLTVTWYPASLAELVPELLSQENSNVGTLLTSVEATIGQVTKGRDFYHARGADAREANALGVPVGAAILASTWLLWSTTDHEDRLVEYGEACLPSRATVSYPYEIPNQPAS